MTTFEPLPLSRETDGPFAGIWTLTLEQPGKPVVVLEEGLIRRLEATLRLVPRDARGLVLRSASERVFVAGADLKAISEMSDQTLDEYLAHGSKVFGMLAALPCATVAAINGAALGGGLELAMHCDGLVAAPSPSGKPYPVGLPEAGLKICPGWGGTNLLAARIEPALALELTMSGKTLSVDEAKEQGLFDAFAPSPSGLLEAAKAWLCSPTLRVAERDGAPSHWIGRTASGASNARREITRRSLESCATLMGSHPADSPAGAVLAAAHAGLTEGWQAALGREHRELIRLRNAPEGKAAIAAFLNKGK
ncbi:MAG: enoyl-CoA hydratase/isomerase family protein [Phycisphaerae bacterium]|jgi:enoyl-CoA hydratase/carnithine racemase